MKRKIQYGVLGILLFVAVGSAFAGLKKTDYLPAILSLLLEDGGGDGEEVFPIDVIIGMPRDAEVSKGDEFVNRVEVVRGLTQVNDEFNFSLVGTYTDAVISNSGVFQFKPRENEDTGSRAFVIRVESKSEGTYKDVEFVISVLETEVVVSGLIGPEGGVVTNEREDIVLKVPPGAVEREAQIRVLRSIKKDGYYGYTVDSSENLLDFLELITPEQLEPISSLDTERAFFDNYNKRSGVVQDKSWESWEHWEGKYYRVDRLDLKDDPVNRRSSLKLEGRIVHNFIEPDEKYNAASLYSLCGTQDNYMCDGKEPVLFVHGYSPDAEDDFGVFPYGQGGGENTWGKFPELVADLGYAVFEFRWRTNSAFADTADDLSSALKLIADKSGKKVHIVAHSFGGLLSRTYIQGQARLNKNYGGEVQSLITFGTPHSGIFDKDGEQEVGGYFYKGQDSSVEMFETCMQSSCNQAGEPTPSAYKIPTRIPLSCIGSDHYSDRCIAELYDPANSSRSIHEELGIDLNPGKRIKELQDGLTNNSYPVNTKVMIGMTIDRKLVSCLVDYDLWNSYPDILKDRYESGDRLITFAGQRFNPISGDTSISGVSLAYQNAGIKVEEEVLGVYGDVVYPGKSLNRTEAFILDSEGKCDEHIDFEGYNHSGRVALLTTRGDAAEVKVNDTKELEDTGKPHASYTAVKEWLQSNTSEPVSVQYLTLKTKVLDAQTELPISGAKIVAYAADRRLGEALSGPSGSVELNLEFIANTSYTLVVNKHGYLQENFNYGYVTGESIDLSGDIFPDIRLNSLSIGGGTLSGSVTDEAGNLIKGVKIVLKRNGIEKVKLTNDSGYYHFDELVGSHYEIVVNYQEYDEIREHFLVKGGWDNFYNIILKKGDVDLVLNDTGTTWGGDFPSGNNSTCTSSIAAQQDCHHGRDATHNDDSDGHAGFSFTKISATGEELPASATSWSCVKDNVTGLMWEVKTDDGGIHDRDNKYRWGGKTRLGDGYGIYYNDWDSLVDGSNFEAFCGITDWRVPTISQLESIVRRGGPNPSIDTAYFPYTYGAWYWSSTPTVHSDEIAWVTIFNYGSVDHYGRDSEFYLRLVGAGR